MAGYGLAYLFSLRLYHIDFLACDTGAVPCARDAGFRPDGVFCVALYVAKICGKICEDPALTLLLLSGESGLQVSEELLKQGAN